MAIIKTNTPFNGYRANVLFRNGVGETTSKHLIEWFKEHGYIVETRPLKEPVKEPEKPKENSIENLTDEVITPPVQDYTIKTLEQMSVDELRTYLKANGMGIKMGSIKNHDRLVEMAKEVDNMEESK